MALKGLIKPKFKLFYCLKCVPACSVKKSYARANEEILKMAE